MILKGSQRGGANALATHLLNRDDNDHVTVQEVRGFAAIAEEELHARIGDQTC